ncbi:MAG: hypothetical protein IJ684_03390 [Bacteroidales bacterium]|nr:hypothetical protein [Bacteroidales bacterium]
MNHPASNPHPYTFADGEHTTDLPHRLTQLRAELNALLDLAADLDDDAYVARGNGFCDTKFSPDFVDSRIATLQTKIAEGEAALAR